MLLDEDLELLTEQECVELLARGGIGRVGVTIQGLPVILPVTYVCIDGDVVFRAGTGTKLHVASHRAIVAFEVDRYDSDTQEGWSVLAVGRSSIVIDTAELEAINETDLTPWAGGTRSSCVRVKPELITGRRIA